ncbi:hypothetical protein [Brevibacillus borstelensis]|uniref:hypothetical protein n=1 Tax=Brevibacillus borstelensis TaxID=45462 RepID=UPI001D0B01AC|nr:hypothetical protein [Brevibacillus borstelensis]MCC0567544.1 hypothetical protein [Brevibacillus borstelensis]
MSIELKVLNGELPSSEVNSQEKAEGSRPPFAVIPADVREAIDPDWDVQILLEVDPNHDGKVFVIKMTSKWGATNPVFFLPSDLYDKKSQQKLIKELVNRGRFHPDEIQALINYVDYLKVAGPGMITPDDGSYKQHIKEISGSVEGNLSDECYNSVLEHVTENVTVFPTRTTNGYKKDCCHGVLLDDDNSLKKYGGLTVAIVSKHMRDIVGIHNTKKLNAILCELARKGVFHPGSHENRKSVTLAEREVDHAYVFSIDPSLLPEGVLKNV